jgi:hypothetical protein
MTFLKPRYRCKIPNTTSKNLHGRLLYLPLLKMRSLLLYSQPSFDEARRIAANVAKLPEPSVLRMGLRRTRCARNNFDLGDWPVDCS